MCAAILRLWQAHISTPVRSTKLVPTHHANVLYRSKYCVQTHESAWNQSLANTRQIVTTYPIYTARAAERRQAIADTAKSFRLDELGQEQLKHLMSERIRHHHLDDLVAVMTHIREYACCMH